GIGFATASAFINAGANVWITGRSAQNLKVAEAKINNSNLKTVVADTSNMSGISVLEKTISELNSKIDVLYLNAGVAAFSPIENGTEEDFDSQFNTNVKGSYFTLSKLIPHLNTGSSVVFTSSTVATARSMGTSV